MHIKNVQVQSKNIMFKIQIATITETAITITETAITIAGEEIATTTAEITITVTEIAITIKKKKINHGINSGTDPFNQSR